MAPHTIPLLLDTSIRNWVLIPILVVMFLIGLFRHYITELMKTVNVEAKGVFDSQGLLRARLLRANGKYIPLLGFQMRKHFFIANDAESKGWLCVEREKPMNPLSDPSQMMGMMKQNMSFVIPQMLIMGWINYFFSGFVASRVPFPLTIRFKMMLQRGIELPTLDASWVSAISLYFLAVFGVRGLYAIVLGDANAAGDSQSMQQMAGMGAMPSTVDMNQVFKAEKENLELCNHDWALASIEQQLLEAHSATASSSGQGSGTKQKQH